MLVELRIRDFAIIDRLDLCFEPGFVALTGETGAGKSIIVDAVELVLGEWADRTVVRAGADRALIEAVFLLGADQRQKIGKILEREGLEGDRSELLLLGREVRLNRRNICRVNGRTVTLSLLRDVTVGLVDIHGQSEHLSLLRIPEQLRLLDRYVGLVPTREQVTEIVDRVDEVRRELTELRRDEREVAHRTDLLEFQINEIRSAGLEPGEERALREERPRLANAERLAELAGEAILAIEEGDHQGVSALDLLGTAVRTLAEAAHVDPSLEAMVESVESVNRQLEELTRQIRQYQEAIEYSPERLHEVEDRLALILRLQRKYGDTVEEVLRYAAEAEDELKAITHSDERLSELEAEEELLLRELGRIALDLSEQRRTGAVELARRIESELDSLGMEGTRFGMMFRWRPESAGVPLSVAPPRISFRVSSAGMDAVEPADRGGELRVAFDRSGVDQVQFLVSTNPGEPLKPMAKVASGGETSRLMLALKAVLSRVDKTPTLVFDEIDQGIGGRMGATVGEKLWGLSVGQGSSDARRQVLCVTHLPQLAGFADEHLRVEKQVVETESGSRSVTRVRCLDVDQRIEELAQMLGGTGEAVYESAQEILRQVSVHKTSSRRD